MLSFYRSYILTSAPSIQDVMEFRFTLSLNQVMVSYTRYSVIDCLLTTLPSLLTIYRGAIAFSGYLSSFNFTLMTIGYSYVVNQRKDS